MLAQPIYIIEQMKSHVFDHERFESLESYMDYMTQAIWRFTGKGVSISGANLEEKCANLVEQLIKNNFIIVH